MGSDDEDLESLRLAALKSRKPKADEFIPHNVQKNGNKLYSQGTSRQDKPFKNQKRIFKGHQPFNRQRNGISRNPRVSSNLISIPIAGEKPPPQSKTEAVKTFENTANTSTEEISSKFSRYDHSEQSDSESEAEEKSDESCSESNKRSERGDSLDRLMDELECEIAAGGSTKPTKKSETKEKRPRQKKKESKTENTVPISQSKSDVDIKVADKNDIENKIIDCDVIIKQEPVPVIALDDDLPSNSPIEEINTKNSEFQSVSPYNTNKNKSLSPISNKDSPRRSRSPFYSRYDRNKSRSRSPLRHPTFFEGKTLSPRVRSISPLGINTEALSTITMAPLSPRSAAFVLKNREIIARRKLSPRRSSSDSSTFSLSRSPTPRRRSLSPRNRSLSPRRMSPRNRPYLSPRRNSRQRSFSPRNRHVSPPRRRSRSPLRSKQYSPKRRSPLVNRPVENRKPPVKHTSPPRTRTPVRKKPIHSRLGTRTDKSKPANTDNVNKKPAQEAPPANNPDQKVNNKKSGQPSEKLDPVLEARRRKFESNVPIEPIGGVIKLKLNSNTESNTNKSEEGDKNENIEDFEEEEEIEDILNDSDCNAGALDHLWSSDESDNENEGRFKLSTKRNNKINVIPFTQLLNGPDKKKLELDMNTGTDTNKPSSDYNRRGNSYRNRKPLRSRRNRSRSPLSNRNRVNKSETSSPKVDKPVEKKASIIKRITLQTKKSEDTEKNAEEIKIKNKSTTQNKETVEPKSESVKLNTESTVPISEIKNVVTSRKVPETVKEQNVVEPEEGEQPEPEIIYEDDEETNKDDGGDLRLELSRRRAQRRAIHAASQLPAARLLQSAFQETLKRPAPLPSLSRPSKVIKHDTKLPIRLRLGLTEAENDEDFLGPLYNAVDAEVDSLPEVSVIKERKKVKSRGKKKRSIKV